MAFGINTKTFSAYDSWILGVVGIAAFAVLVFFRQMGDHYHEFYDEDVKFFRKELNGSSDRASYWIMYLLAFVVAFLGTMHNNTSKAIRERIVGASTVQFAEIFQEYYNSDKWTFLRRTSLSVAWETVYEVLWVYLALTDLYAVVAVLLGRLSATLLLTFHIHEESVVVNSKIGHSLHHRSGSMGKSLMF